MTLKLNAGLSRKVADGNYGSRGASVNLELELDTELVNDPPKLQEKIKKLFNVVRTSLDEELNGGHQPSTEVKPAAPTNGNGNGYVQRGGKRQATPNQVKAIYAIAHNRQIDLNQFLNERFHVSRPNDLTIKDASTAYEARYVQTLPVEIALDLLACADRQGVQLTEGIGCQGRRRIVEHERSDLRTCLIATDEQKAPETSGQSATRQSDAKKMTPVHDGPPSLVL